MYGLLKWVLLAWAASQLFRKEKVLADGAMPTVPAGGAVVPPGGTLDDLLMQAFAADWIAGTEDVGDDDRLFKKLSQAAVVGKIPVRWLIAFVAMAQAAVPKPDFHRRAESVKFQDEMDDVARHMRQDAEASALPAMADVGALGAWRKAVVQDAVERWVKAKG